ncbi:hypothetical protein EV200_104382 [Pedobacter psychrotolerans]|uniref:Uncharacterized protein n=1 Tax=Pedobacter psychrotolerans TaxID=1843235 RepID=A0A4R2HDA3_9SPHI|nr:hypothetical protein EV200_104382 [Pedobacter psychrotolerans]
MCKLAAKGIKSIEDLIGAAMLDKMIMTTGYVEYRIHALLSLRQ